MPTITRAHIALASILAAACAEPPRDVPAAAVGPGRFASCEVACAQHCGAVSSMERAACEQGQVGCGCAPGMRRPPVSRPPPVTPAIGEAEMGEMEEVQAEEAEVEDAVPGCFGASVPLTVWAGTPYAEVRFGVARGAFLIDFGTTGSSIDPLAFDPPPDGTSGCYDGMHFFGPWPCTPLRRGDHAGVGAPFRQAGIFGTDVLSRHAYVIDYRAGRLARSERFCSEAALAAGGMIPLASSGYGPGRIGVHVPAITVRIAGVTVPAQLDTGFADRRVRHSININRALFAAIGGDALEAMPSSDLVLSTCVAGVSEPVRAYRLRRGALEWLGRDGAVARAFGDATLFLKDTPAEAARCGGIGTWATPGAQLGASFAETVGILAIDGRTGLVWIAGE